jgi:hypothetical protein
MKIQVKMMQKRKIKKMRKFLIELLMRKRKEETHRWQVKGRKYRIIYKKLGILVPTMMKRKKVYKEAFLIRLAGGKILLVARPLVK